MLSNRAIQFRDRHAAAQLIETARGLWQLELAPQDTGESGLDAAAVSRIRRNLVRRVSQLARQDFIREWPDIEHDLGLLGGHAWREAETLMATGNIDQAEAFLVEALTWAPYAVPLLAYRGQLAATRGQDPKIWFQRSLAGYPKLALPVLLPSQYLVTERRPHEAIAVLQAAVSERDYDETLLYMLGDLMSVHASGVQLIEFFSSRSNHDARPQTSHYFVALGHHQLGNRAAAILALRRALEIDPAHEMSQAPVGPRTRTTR